MLVNNCKLPPAMLSEIQFRLLQIPIFLPPAAEENRVLVNKHHSLSLCPKKTFLLPKPPWTLLVQLRASYSTRAVACRFWSAGADVNQKLFRGYATTAAAREGHHHLLGLLLKAGASQPACEDALLEACRYGQAKAAELLISSEMIRHEAAADALVYASCRGFVETVSILIKNGVDVNSWDRALLRSAKPALHANVDCTPLIAAIVSRQAPVVKYLLEAGAKTNYRVSIGAWSWDTDSVKSCVLGHV